VLFIVAGLSNPASEPQRTKLVCFGLECLAAAQIVALGTPLLH
jgi:hypothetical protein